jgi:calcineurin-like phosphoesterase
LRVEEILNKFNHIDFDGIILDFHKEVSSSWYWIVHYFENKISFVYWTHTHIQTNDDYIFESWVWILSDVGMTWPFNSVIWADFKTVKNRFLTWLNTWKIEQSLDKKYILNAVVVDIENKKTTNIEKIRIINHL